MKVTLAKSAGFCFGVKRAVETVYEKIDRTEDPIYTFGPIIHNEEVVADLERKGVTVVNSVEELKDKPKGTVIIRAHGVEQCVYEGIRNLGFEVVDATCPFVLKIHRLVEKYSKEDYHVVIIGNETHPEVIGIKSWSATEATTVLSSKQEAEEFVPLNDRKVCIVSQTTFNYNKFQELVEKISRTSYDINVLNTICNATQERQVEAKKIASQVDVMLVIGGKHSSNTQKLYEICQKECKNTYYIQTIGDLNPECISSACNVGITAGASTPNNIIEEVHTNVRVKF